MAQDLLAIGAAHILEKIRYAMRIQSQIKLKKGGGTFFFFFEHLFRFFFFSPHTMSKPQNANVPSRSGSKYLY
jgi:hypothetical protein